MTSTAEQDRPWIGPVILSFGFRPFFFGAALWAALAMGLWILMLTGHVTVPTAFDPVSWHVHEVLYGYLGAVLAGFLLTAVPSWTDRPKILGWPLVGLFALWFAGRVAIVGSAGLEPSLVAGIDLMFLVILCTLVARDVIAGRNWRNLIVVALLGVFILSNGLFHWSAAQGGDAAHGVGTRLGIAASIMLIAVIGGRVVPAFTRNWLVKRDSTRLPTPPMQRFDKICLLAFLAALAVWVPAPDTLLAGLLMLIAGSMHLVRLARWSGRQTGAEALVWVLHAAYLFVPLGALALALAIVAPQALSPTTALHLWMAGAIGVMTLAVMTRAALGHSGRELTAGRGTQAIYIGVILSVVLRIAAGQLPTWAIALYGLSALSWIAAFAGFALLYAPMMFRPRVEE